MIQHQDLIHIHVIYTKLNICGLRNRFAASIYIFGQGLGRDICPVQTHVDRKLCGCRKIKSTEILRSK